MCQEFCNDGWTVTLSECAFSYPKILTPLVSHWRTNRSQWSSPSCLTLNTILMVTPWPPWLHTGWHPAWRRDSLRLQRRHRTFHRHGELSPSRYTNNNPDTCTGLHREDHLQLAMTVSGVLVVAKAETAEGRVWWWGGRRWSKWDAGGQVFGRTFLFIVCTGIQERSPDRRVFVLPETGGGRRILSGKRDHIFAKIWSKS